MIIDNSIANDYMNDNEISGHWLFSSIEEGRQLFVKPRASLKPAVREVMTEINHSLEDFVPFNRALYSDLFPHWQSVMKRINVLLAVGCPHKAHITEIYKGGADGMFVRMGII